MLIDPLATSLLIDQEVLGLITGPDVGGPPVVSLFLYAVFRNLNVLTTQ